MAITPIEKFQFQDRVEVVHYHEFGEVRKIDLEHDEVFVRLDSGHCGWFRLAELRHCGGAPASNPEQWGPEWEPYIAAVEAGR